MRKLNKFKLLCVTVLALCITHTSYAKKVEESDALKVVEKVLKKENKILEKMGELIPIVKDNDTLLYVAKLKEKEGFIILSADYSAPPVLGVTFKGEYLPDSLPGGLVYLMERYKAEISYLKKKEKEPTTKTKLKWQNYLTESPILKSTSAIKTVSPMISTRWGQSYGYNMYCPTNCYAGCTAVAIAQILFFWKYPVNQTGSNTHDGLTVNFGDETYCWSNMDWFSPNTENAKLIYHAGVSCNTNYGTNGSSSYPDNAENAFINYWGMSPNVDVKWRMWNIFDWHDMLEVELDSGRPLLYSGGNILNGGHSWVIDGYNSDGDFYCNWGYYGTFNGYFSLGEFDPDRNGTEYWGFDEVESAIFYVYPATEIASGITGPSTVVQPWSRYTVDNKADCQYVSWKYSSNIGAQYGGENWVAIYPKSSGQGWIQASYNINGTTYNTSLHFRRQFCRNPIVL